MISSRYLCDKIWQKLTFIKILDKEFKVFSTLRQPETQLEDNNNSKMENNKLNDSLSFVNYRFIYPEFLPDPNPLYRNNMREKLERMDMLSRRSVLNIPEFYVGSILAVTYSDLHTNEKINKFVGICILRKGTGLRSSFLLRNVVNGEGVEVSYDLYDPAIQKIDCLKLERRLDDELLYLRDAPLEYSTFPFDMEMESTFSKSVPINKIKIPLNPLPWSMKWELKNLKGVKDLIVNEKRRKKAEAYSKPWEKYDLMKTYRETIPEEEQIEIFSDVHTELRHLEIQKSILKRKNILKKQKIT
ncbi:39S ribosomal protein L19, mitochondrial [Apis mellifera caucasica]|uniref:Large ribosomal subunit protein bL19m n=1 Tax=Apis mellifera TaxID=7460 RepID=A0A7M7R909_APIME|nr:39S ribosomal protein L19, mitochondrial [Apis mellifera]KAG6803522.1 39S ribosomal protein L19, mitochondrial [Apis mellifera caucasica]KAG9435468.1 39S ribosomal protein L19, mitochondrial [Apis mellifera carnica]|eukprot:XP_624971.1 39S ribosomal protein L19, mitochondrial [Apis mellifera]